MMKIFNDKEGFTLLEVLVAMVVFTLGVLALFAMQIGAIKGNSQANSITTASTLAHDQIERIISWDSSAVANNLIDTNTVFSGAGADGADITADNSVVPNGYENYTVYWDGTAIMDPGNITQQIGYRVEIHVVWFDGTRQRQMTMNLIKII
jgi:type IV pilus modification protein PilV